MKTYDIYKKIFQARVSNFVLLCCVTIHLTFYSLFIENCKDTYFYNIILPDFISLHGNFYVYGILCENLSK